MKAYIIESRKKIEPFGEHPRDCLIVNKKLSLWQKEILSEKGIELVPISNISKIESGEECIFFDENLYFTPELLSEFIRKAREQRTDAVCCLKKGVTTLRTGTGLQGIRDFGEYVEYNLKYFSEGSFTRKKWKPIVIEPDELRASVLMPKHMCDSDKGYAVPMTEKFVIQIDHWVNLWIANILTLLAKLARVQKMPKLKLVLAALKARSGNKWKILQGLNRIGENCDIHPTAYVEASTIGNNVTIGAKAVVRDSEIGSNVFIGNNVVVEESVIGEKSSILHGHILYSVFYPGTFSVAGMISASLIGRDSFLGANASLTDFRFDKKNVLVEKNGTKADSGNIFLGACLGHGVYLGSGCIIAPGRTIANGLRISLKRDRIFTAADSDEKGFRIIGT